MKKLLSLILTVMLISVMAAFSIPASAEGIFEDPSNINIVYLGGSITAGAGAGGGQNWVDITGKYFSKTFGENNVHNHNVGVGGTGSEYGLLRLKRDVIDKNPDMVFIEFAVNDGGRDTTRYLESMVLSLQKLEKVPYICFVYTTNRTLNVNQTYQRAVADYYGLAQIDFQARMTQELKDNPKNTMETYLGDSVHPNATGYAVYGDEVTKCLATGKYYTKPKVMDKKYNSKSLFVNTTFTPAADYVTTNGWQKSGNFVTTFEDVGAAGQKLHFDFTGNVLAIEHRLHKNGGMYKVIIDGKTMATVSDYYKDNGGQLVLGYSNFDLGQGKHTLDIEVTDQKDNASGGYMVGLYNIITNENPDYDSTKVDVNFNDGDTSAIADIGVTPSPDWEWDGTVGADGSKGALKVTTATGTYGSSTGVAFNVSGLEKGRSYHLSAKVKLDSIEKLVTDSATFIFRLDGVDESGNPTGKNALVKVDAPNAGLNNKEFTEVQAEFTFDGTGVLTSNKPTLCNSDGSFEVRVGSDKLEETTGSRDTALVYYIDDIKMIPGKKTSGDPSNPDQPSTDEIKILVDGIEVQADVPPVIVDDRTLVPFRAIFEALGADVEWEAETRTANVARDGIAVAIQIDNRIMKINGEDFELDVPAQIIDDRTMVPVRAISESFNAKVEWVPETRTVIVTTK